jgi:peptidoglycan/xylan/chitin deacetylase (PgdA/CDA1 family)
MPDSGKQLFLTFDDGPHPEITIHVLDLLNQYNAKATFFCVGENVKKFPLVYEMLLKAGHAVGNHTSNHLNGLKTKTEDYIASVEECRKQIDSKLFRPPYGRIKRSQLKYLSQHYSIVMWNTLSGDFDQNTSEEDCWANVKNHAKSGSIIVFHDSEKAQKNMVFALRKTLEHFSNLGYSFCAINTFKK